MAIFNMSDSSINEYYLNEHGGAHRKYGDIAKRKQELNEKIADSEAKKSVDYAFDRISKNPRFKNLTDKEKDDMMRTHGELAKKHNEEAMKHERIAYKLGTTKSPSYSTTKYINSKNKAYARSVGKMYKDDFRKMVDEKSGKPKNQELHKRINQRSSTKLREAAEYILSVLDEMDYIEGSERKIGDRLKDAANRIRTMNRGAIDRAKDYIKNPKGYDKRQKEKFFKQDQK